MPQKTGIEVRIFMGLKINSEVKMHLNYSEEWKLRKIDHSEESLPLEEIKIKNNVYFGFFFEKPPTLQKIEEMEKRFFEEIRILCPEMNSDKLSCIILPQTFLS